MRTKTLIMTTIMLVLLLTQTMVYSTTAHELDRDQIKVTIHINEMIEMEINNNLLDFDLSEGISSDMEFNSIANSPLAVSFESAGFGEELDELFQYIVVYTEEGQEKQQIFKPGSYIQTDIIVMEPGKTKWKLIIKLQDNVARQWELILDEGIENIETVDLSTLGTEWTELTPGVYTDFVNMTFHKYDIDGYIMERSE